MKKDVVPEQVESNLSTQLDGLDPEVKLLQFKHYSQKGRDATRLHSIRCYIAYEDSPFHSRNEWIQWLNSILKDSIDGSVTFIEMGAKKQGE